MNAVDGPRSANEPPIAQLPGDPHATDVTFTVVLGDVIPGMSMAGCQSPLTSSMMNGLAGDELLAVACIA
jgi:hypothetical protein